METKRMGERITALVSEQTFSAPVMQRVVEELWDADEGEYVVVYGEAVRRIGEPELLRLLNAPAPPEALTVIAA